MAISNYASKLIPYAGKWVALSPDRKDVLASGLTIREIDKELEEKKILGQDIENIIISKIPLLNSTISPWLKY
jgi:hypothetical protein